jgi:hypothetical protein
MSMSAWTGPTATRVVDQAPAPITAANGARFMPDSGPAQVTASSTVEGPPQPPIVVNTDAGPVTLVELPTLTTRAQAAQEIGDDSAGEAKSLRDLADGLWMQRGQALVSKVGAWEPPSALKPLVEQARALTATVEAEASRLQSIQDEPHSGISGLVGRVSSWNQSRQVSAERAKALAQLKPLLVQIGRQSPSPTAGDADVIGSQATAAESQAQNFEARSKEAAALAASTNDEVQRRTASVRELGFDALYTAAYLNQYGAQPVQSPLMLKRGEQAFLSVTATLARQQTRRQWVGGSSGFSFPIGHTGIRYRVGSFRGHPIEQQFLGKLGLGTLVVTNQRIAFVGTTKSTSVALTKLLHVECYSDALAVFQEGRETPDFFFVGQPKLAVFWINWLLARASS